jgi:hypothetical protein
MLALLARSAVVATNEVSRLVSRHAIAKLDARQLAQLLYCASNRLLRVAECKVTAFGTL